MTRFNVFLNGVLAAGVLALAIVLILLVLELEKEMAESQLEFRDNVTWNTSQMERDLLVFLLELDSYAEHEDPIAHERLQESFDVFWSRISGASQGSVGAYYRSFEGAEAAIEKANTVLRQVEPLVANLKPGDRPGYDTIRLAFEGMAEAFHAVTVSAVSAHNKRVTAMFRERDEAQRTILLTLAGVLAGGTLLVVLILIEKRQIGALQGSLERRVDERTRDLEQENLERRRAEMALRESEGRFRSVLENYPCAIFLKDIEGRFRMVNPCFEELYGVSADEMIGKASHDVFPKEAADNYVSHDEEVLRSGQASEREYDMRLPDGSEHRVIATKFPVLGSDGEVIGVGAINADVTEQRHAEEQLRRSQRLEAVGKLTGGVAHDFNNLLAVILGNADILMDRIGEEPKLADSLDAVQRAALRGRELTQRLLAFSRSQPLSPEVLDLSELVGDLKGLLSRTLGETIRIETRVESRLWTTLADRGQVENALLNLALNAKHAMVGGGRLTIEVRNQDVSDADAALQAGVAPGDFVVLSVADDGTGMSPEVLERAFEPFFTTKEVGEGSGLGLSMVYGFAKQSNGTATIDSEVGQGTTVRLYLPRAGEAARPLERAPMLEEPKGQGERILVAEDDSEVRRLVVKVLDTLGYDVLEAEDGKACLQRLLEVGDVDLLLSDIVLPGGMSGPEMVRQAKQGRPDLKVMFMSGYADSSVRPLGDLDESFEIIAKPFTKRQLAHRLRAVLDADLSDLATVERSIP
jgi:PAS domain S-box-containing protein